MPNTRFKTILAVVTDPFAKEQPALTKGASIASRVGAKLIVLNTFMIPEPVSDAVARSSDEIIAAAKRHRQAQLERLVAKWRKRSVKLKIHVEWDFPAHEAVIRVVQRQAVDLVVAHSHRHGTFARWLLANTDWELIRHCPCPVWFVRNEKLPARHAVLVAVDPFHSRDKPARLDDQLLSTAVALTDELGGNIGLVHAYRAPVTSTPGRFSEPFGLSSPSLDREYVSKVDKAMKKLAVRHAIAPARCHLVEGAPESAIGKLIEQREAHLLVMGAISRSALQRAVIGNTAEKVIDAVPCDVLVIKPRGFKTSVPKVRPR